MKSSSVIWELDSNTNAILTTITSDEDIRLEYVQSLGHEQ